jgi:exodeoxyribonuclease-3
MRIVVWNCAMKLAGKKLKSLEDLQPDLAVVPECACPDRLWGKQPLLAPVAMDWIGDDEHQGLGVLAFNGYRVLRHRAYDRSLRWLLPVEVKGPAEFHLLAVWAVHPPAANAAHEAPAAHPLQAVERYRKFLLAAPSVVAGDFHHNVHSDRGAATGQQAHLVAGLERLGLASAYHVGRGELHGKETAPTLYGRSRALDGPKYHVDYCLLPLEWCSYLRQVELGPFDAWVGSGLSDHVPLIVDVDLPGRQPATPSRPGKTVRTDLEDLRRPQRRCKG